MLVISSYNHLEYATSQNRLKLSDLLTAFGFAVCLNAMEPPGVNEVLKRQYKWSLLIVSLTKMDISTDQTVVRRFSLGTFLGMNSCVLDAILRKILRKR